MGWWTRSEARRTAVRMLALLAALCFVLALFKVTVPFNLVTLGLAVLALHLAWPIDPWATVVVGRTK